MQTTFSSEVFGKYMNLSDDDKAKLLPVLQTGRLETGWQKALAREVGIAYSEKVNPDGISVEGNVTETCLDEKAVDELKRILNAELG